jgi:hypothetical protein
MKNNFIKSLIFTLGFLLLVNNIAIGQNRFQIPGQTNDNYRSGKKIEIFVPKPGKCLFTIVDPTRKIGKDNMLTGISFKNRVSVNISDARGNSVGSNYFGGDSRGVVKSSYLESFTVEFTATGTYLLEIKPLDKKDNNRKFRLTAEYLQQKPKIFGMTWSRFLETIGGFLGIALILFVLIFFKQYQKLPNVDSVKLKGEVLRAAKERVERIQKQGEATHTAEQNDQRDKSSDRFCGKCGLPRQPGEKFCGECGNRFDD